MLAAACIFAGAVNLAGCIPARWPSGDPKTLDLLDHSPINALLVESAHWSAPFSKAAAARHLAVLGVIHPSQNAEALALRALRDHLDALVFDGNFPRKPPAVALPAIELPARQRISLDPSALVAGTSEALWPGVEIEHGGKVSTGPSSAPWIDTNTGFLRFLSAATRAPIWLGERPPPGNVFPVQRYLLAIADSGVVNARWIVTLDSDLEKRLLARHSDALREWSRINAYLRYFEDHPEWRRTTQFGKFAVLQDVASGGLLSASLLDMLSVLHKSARPLPARELDANHLENTEVLLNATGDLNTGQEREVAGFAASGGKVLNPPAGWSFPPIAPDQRTPTRKQVDAIQPLWEITYNATLSRNFGARTFNTSTIIFSALASADGKRLLVHLLNYADYVSEDIAVQAAGAWKSARLLVPGEPAQTLPVYPVQDGTEADVSKIEILGTVIFER